MPRRRGSRRSRRSARASASTSCFEWKWVSDGTPLSPAVRRAWRRYNQTAALYDRLDEAGPSRVRSALARLAGWRLRTGRYALPIEQKLYDLYVRTSAPARPR